MKATLTLILSPLLLLGMICCQFDSESEEKESKTLDGKTLTTNVKKTRTNQSPQDESMREKLHGIWYSNHEPLALEFYEDGSYRGFIIPETSAEPDSPEEEYDSGTWMVEDGHLVLNSESTKPQKILISWVEEKLIYLGDIEVEYDSTYGSKTEFAEEMGLSKVAE